MTCIKPVMGFIFAISCMLYKSSPVDTNELIIIVQMKISKTLTSFIKNVAVSGKSGSALSSNAPMIRAGMSRQIRPMTLFLRSRSSYLFVESWMIL